ncbi:MAG: type II toxin-antitoxin system VapC family toxin [Spirochaetales bacterium]|nr:type II toxin-antitoxin system VapC family toxin [Spirochaetales bacterium]
MTYYFDTSAFIKIYHREAGTDEVLALYKSNAVIFISELCKIEFISTIKKKYRERIISHDTLQALINKFQDDLENRYTVLKFSSLVIDEAENLLKQYGDEYGLRTLDSLQFAFLTTYCEKENTQFACSDSTLIQLVGMEEYTVFNPEKNI